MRTAMVLVHACTFAHACRAVIYGGDLSGWQAVFTDGEYDYDQYVQYAVDNEATSLIVEGNGCAAIVYEHKSFQGWKAVFPEGKYGMSEFVARGAVNDAASALRVGYGQTGKATGCKDEPGWVDPFGHGCKAYEKDKHCAGGNTLHMWIRSVEFNNPHLHCCACGGKGQGKCVDTVGWHDQYGHGCDNYVKEGNCGGGKVLHDWIMQAEFRHPHLNCCACGK